MNIKNIAFLIGGIVIGAAAGVASTHAYFKAKYEKKYDHDIREYYEIYSKENFEENLVDKNEDKQTEEKEEEKNSISQTISLKKHYDEMAKIYAPTTDYHKISKERTEKLKAEAASQPDLAESQSPTEEEWDELEAIDQENGIAPLSKDAYESATPHYDKVEITYYELDDIWYNEVTGVEEDPLETCGRGVIARFGKEVDDEAYSRNYNNDVDYLVYCCHGRYADRE